MTNIRKLMFPSSLRSRAQDFDALTPGTSLTFGLLLQIFRGGGLIWWIKSRKTSSIQNFLQDPFFECLSFMPGFDDRVDESPGDDHGAVSICNHYVVRIYCNAAASNWLLPVNERQVRD